ncbi:MAG: hypothetical protein H0W71_05770 [Sphingomonas sp.]|nr:hypothetical protein [Sphingomonas sp.]
MIGPDPAGQMRMFGSSAQPLSAGEIDMVQRFVREHPEAFGPRAAPFDSNQWIRPVDSNRIRFRFLPFASGTQALLNTENGTNQSYSFKARIERGSKSVTTDVCQLVPAKRSVEHWPYPLDWIEITDMHVVPYDETELPRCE